MKSRVSFFSSLFSLYCFDELGQHSTLPMNQTLWRFDSSLELLLGNGMCSLFPDVLLWRVDGKLPFCCVISGTESSGKKPGLRWGFQMLNEKKQIFLKNFTEMMEYLFRLCSCSFFLFQDCLLLREPQAPLPVCYTIPWVLHSIKLPPAHSQRACAAQQEEAAPELPSAITEIIWGVIWTLLLLDLVSFGG